MTQEERITHLRTIARKGGKARAKQFTSDSQRAARAALPAEAVMRGAKEGARVTMERYGAEVLIERSRQRRLEKPSAPEQAMIDVLAGLGQQAGVNYVREWYPLGPAGLLTVDFAWPDRKVAIEVNGPVHALFGDPAAEAARQRRLEQAGWTLLIVDWSEVTHPATISAIRSLI